MVFRVIDHLADCPPEYAFHRHVRPVPANSINRWSAKPQSTETFGVTLAETFGDAVGRLPPHDPSSKAATNIAVVFISMLQRRSALGTTEGTSANQDPDDATGHCFVHRCQDGEVLPDLYEVGCRTPTDRFTSLAHKLKDALGLIGSGERVQSQPLVLNGELLRRLGTKERDRRGAGQRVTNIDLQTRCS